MRDLVEQYLEDKGKVPQMVHERTKAAIETWACGRVIMLPKPMTITVATSPTKHAGVSPPLLHITTSAWITPTTNTEDYYHTLIDAIPESLTMLLLRLTTEALGTDEPCMEDFNEYVDACVVLMYVDSSEPRLLDCPSTDLRFELFRKFNMAVIPK